MKAVLNALRPYALTGLMVLFALWAGYKLWDYYFDAPWTRDGHVRADVVPVAPDVSGFVTEIPVKDNQRVHRGDVIFRIDRVRFALVLPQTQAVVAGRKAMLDQATSDPKRYHNLSDIAVTQQKLEQVDAAQREAAYDQAVADQAVAQLNLDRSEINAPVNGTISNMERRPGIYVTAGAQTLGKGH